MSKVHNAHVDIKPSVFATMDGVNRDYHLAPATTGQIVYAITDDYTEDAPIPNVVAEFAATAGNPLAIITEHGDRENATAMLCISAAVTRGQLLMPDATGDGSAIPHVAGAGNWYGAIADESGVAGEILRVLPRFGVA